MVNPASSVLRTLGIARINFIAGSSDTELIIVPPAPPIRKLSSMSMSPGSSVMSPSSITSASSGMRSGDTSRMCSRSTITTPGSTMRTRFDVDHPVGLEHHRVVGRLRPGAGRHGRGHGVGSPTRSRYAAPESGTCGCFQHSTANDTEINE